MKKPAAKKSSSAIAAAAAAEAKARAAKKGNKKDKSTFNQVGVSVVQRTLACVISQIRMFLNSWCLRAKVCILLMCSSTLYMCSS